MRVLVTGHRGYIGSLLVPLLQDAGHDVRGLDSDLYAGCTFAGDLPEIPWIRKDVRDVERADLADCDAVVHLAGLSNDPLGDLDPGLTDAVNHAASVRLAELARDSGVGRFLFASSCSNYGAAGDALLDESADFNPVTPYGRSKVAVEGDVAPMAADDFCPVFLRAGTAFGRSPRLRFDLVLNNLTAWAAATGRIYLKSDGSPWRPVVHAEDIGRAYVAALAAPADRVRGRAYNVGRTDQNYRIRDLAGLVEEAVPGTRIDFAPDAGPDARNYRVDCGRIARELPDFRPQWDARRGAAELAAALVGSGVAVEEFEGPRFQRVAHLKSLIADGRLGGDLRWRDPDAR